MEGVRLLFADRRLRLLVTLLSCIAGFEGLVIGVLVLVAPRKTGVYIPVPMVYFSLQDAIGTVPGALLTERFVARIGSALTLLVDASGPAGWHT